MKNKKQKIIDDKYRLRTSRNTPPNNKQRHYHQNANLIVATTATTTQRINEQFVSGRVDGM